MYDFLESKILDVKTVKKEIRLLQSVGKKIVFTNGCFDLLHPGHVIYLEKAKEFGNVLVIGLNSDDSVRMLKGADRPIVAEKSRALVLAALRSVDFIIFFDEETPEQLIHQLKPDIIVKGGDYKVEEIAGAEWLISQGKDVRIIPFVDGFSSTSIVSKIKQQKS